jgi:hypothetical protein
MLVRNIIHSFPYLRTDESKDVINTKDRILSWCIS